MKTAWGVCVALVVLGATSLSAGEKQPEVKGPLAGLPSAPGPHIEKLKALGEDAWLDLGKPAPDPKWGMGHGLSYLPNMAWAPNLKCAFIMGTGPHGCTHKYADGTTRWENDVWAYDLMAHRWVCLYPGLDIDKAAFKLDDKGAVLVDDGHPMLGSHGYQHFCYDPTAGRLFHLSHAENTDYFPKRMKEEWYRVKVAKGGSRCGPFSYDPRTDEWKLLHPAGPEFHSKGGNHVLYSPKLKRAILVDPGALWEFDSEKEAWIERKVQNTAKVGYCCTAYDTKRDRVLFVGSGPRGEKKDAPAVLAGLDIAGGEVRALGSDGLEGLGGTDWMNVVLTYDEAGDALVLVIGGTMRIYDCAGDKWLPAKALDSVKPAGCWNGFYVPEFNVHIFHESGDSAPTRRILAYRYKAEPKK